MSTAGSYEPAAPTVVEDENGDVLYVPGHFKVGDPWLYLWLMGYFRCEWDYDAEEAARAAVEADVERKWFRYASDDAEFMTPCSRFRRQKAPYTVVTLRDPAPVRQVTA